MEVTAGSGMMAVEVAAQAGLPEMPTWHLDEWQPLRAELLAYRERHGRLPYGVAKAIQMEWVRHFAPAPEGMIELMDDAYAELRSAAYDAGPKPLDPFGGINVAQLGSRPPSRAILRKCRVDRGLQYLAKRVRDMLDRARRRGEHE